MATQTLRQKYDVIIVGAGPAGSTLGSLLAEWGLDIILIDKHKFPRPKLCGGVITWKTRTLLERLFNISFREHFSIEAITDDYFLYEKNRVKILQKSPEPFYFVDRKKYDLALVSLARKKGCQTLFGDDVVDINAQNNAVITKSGARFHSEIIMGADGAQSLVRKKIFKSIQHQAQTGVAFQICVPIEKLKTEYQNSVPKIFTGLVDTGYGWMFPQDDHFLIGLWGMVRKNGTLRKTFIGFLNNVTTSRIEKTTHIPVSILPVRQLLTRPGEQRILLSGDAAGFVDVMTGEGIYYAHQSAVSAARAIHGFFDSQGESDLVQSYQRHLSPLLKELVISRRLGALAYSRLRYVVYLLMKSPKFSSRLAEMIHGIKSYSRIPLLSIRVNKGADP